MKRRTLLIATLLGSAIAAIAAPKAKLALPRPDPKMIATGRTLFMNRCARCHSLPRVSDHTAEQWSRIVPKMARRSGLKPDQQAAVIAYLSSGRAK